MTAAGRLQSNRYEQLYNEFRWHVPNELNIADVCCNRWAKDTSRIAIHYEDDSGHASSLTFGALKESADRLSNLLVRLGVTRGDRIAIILPQRPETAVTHMACYQLGAVAMPLSILFGPDALEYRLQNSDAVAAIVDGAGCSNLEEVRANCPSLKHIIAIDCDAKDALDWKAQLAQEDASFTPKRTLATDPAVLIYTSGTTGAPKGALIPHSAIIGNRSPATSAARSIAITAVRVSPV